jgi:hypothetical protein
MNDGCKSGTALDSNSGLANCLTIRIANRSFDKSGSQLRLGKDGSKK